MKITAKNRLLAVLLLGAALSGCAMQPLPAQAPANSVVIQQYNTAGTAMRSPNVLAPVSGTDSALVLTGGGSLALVPTASFSGSGSIAPATGTSIGGVIIGNGLTITTDGTIALAAGANFIPYGQYVSNVRAGLVSSIQNSAYINNVTFDSLGNVTFDVINSIPGNALVFRANLTKTLNTFFYSGTWPVSQCVFRGYNNSTTSYQVSIDNNERQLILENNEFSVNFRTAPGASIPTGNYTVSFYEYQAVAAQGGADMLSGRVVNTADPINAKDAVNLQTLQAAIAEVPSGGGGGISWQRMSVSVENLTPAAPGENETDRKYFIYGDDDPGNASFTLDLSDVSSTPANGTITILLMVGGTWVTNYYANGATIIDASGNSLTQVNLTNGKQYVFRRTSDIYSNTWMMSAP
ncbi:MAG: hypothetical protein LBM92_03015 [Opitutaceae bacterium]|nr:hypothetical protein [Opitutaceae bacterium]